jgi:hypothetical protein
MGMFTDDIPGSHGSNVQEAYGSIQAGSDTITVTENDYWPDTTLIGYSHSNEWPVL